MPAWWDQKVKMLKSHRFLYVFRRVKDGPVNPRKQKVQRPGPTWRGKGEGKPSPLWACLRFGRFGGFGGVSKHLHGFPHRRPHVAAGLCPVAPPRGRSNTMGQPGGHWYPSRITVRPISPAILGRGHTAVRWVYVRDPSRRAGVIEVGAAGKRKLPTRPYFDRTPPNSLSRSSFDDCQALTP